MTCPLCDGPLIWSDDHGRRWCAVYGDHPEQRPKNIYRRNHRAPLAWLVDELTEDTHTPKATR